MEIFDRPLATTLCLSYYIFNIFLSKSIDWSYTNKRTDDNARYASFRLVMIWNYTVLKTSKVTKLYQQSIHKVQKFI